MKKIKVKTTFFKDFKEFITKGNVIDMAVGVVIGGSFGKIVTGLVNYIINPFVAIFVKGGSMDAIKTVITPEVVVDGVVKTKEVAILWGTWLQTVVDFLITAFCIFCVLRIIMTAKKALEYKKLEEEKKIAEEKKAEEEAAAKKAEEEAAALKKRQEELEENMLNMGKTLSEIRDLLKNK